MPEVNYLAVLLSALSAFLLGGLWYSPVLFANKWVALTGQGEEKLKSGSMATIFGGAFLCNLVAAYVFAIFMTGVPDLARGAGYGAMTGFGLVAMSMGLNYLFERRPLGLWLINGGYFTLQFTFYGLIVAAMGPPGPA